MTRSHDRPRHFFALIREPAIMSSVRIVEAAYCAGEPHCSRAPSFITTSDLLRSAQILYRLIRRLGIMDVSRLMQLRKSDCRQTDLAEGYDLRLVTAAELDRLLETGRVATQVGEPEILCDAGRAIVAAFQGDRVVSFLWLARDAISAADNYSRAPHLGTSLVLPEGTAFVFNAWTNPDHRGKRLIASLLAYAIGHQVLGANTLLTTIDWTNQKSIRAFGYLGMKKLGTIVRMGQGRLQFSLIPRLDRLGLQIAQDTPGYTMAV